MEPERNIEKWLRAFAKKRRARAAEPTKLHPATRRLLQAEVSRRIPRADEPSSLSLWQLFRQQWAVLLGFALVMFLGASLLLPALSSSKNRAQGVMAMSNLRQIGVAAQVAAQENNGKLPDTLDELTNGLLKKSDLVDPQSGKPFVYLGAGKSLDDLQSNDVLAYSTAGQKGHLILLGDGQVQYAQPDRFAKLTNRGALQLALAAKTENKPLAAMPPSELTPMSPPMAATSPSRPPVAAERPIDKLSAGSASSATGAPGGSVFAERDEATRRADAPAQTRQLLQSVSAQANQNRFNNFQNSYRNRVADQSATVLASFQVVQNGDTIRVLDRDGSVYNGSLRTNGVKDLGVEGARGGMLAGAVAAQSFYFRVTGTNVTLNQPVVFVGNVQAFSNTPESEVNGTVSGGFGGGGGGGGAGGGERVPQRQGGRQTGNNLRIDGMATVAGTNHIQVEALPENP